MQLVESRFKSLSCAGKSPQSRWAGESHHQVQPAMADKFLQVHASSLPSGSKGRNSSSPTQTAGSSGEKLPCLQQQSKHGCTQELHFLASVQHPLFSQTHRSTCVQYNALHTQLSQKQSWANPQLLMFPLASSQHTLPTPRENPNKNQNKTPKNLSCQSFLLPAAN